MSSKQDIESGDNSVNIQAHTVSVIGLSYADTKAMLLDLFAENFPRLVEMAAATAIARAEEIVDQFLHRLAETSPNSFANLKDPGVQMALIQVQREYARSGDKDVGDLLVEILVDRVSRQDRTIRQLALDGALNAVPLITRSGVDCLTIMWFFKNVQMPTRSIDEFYDLLREQVVPFASNLVASYTELRHLEYAGCVSIGIGQINLVNAITQRYPGLFSKGFEKTEDGVTDLTGSGIIMPCMRDPAKMQVNALNDAILHGEISRLNLGAHEANIRRLFNTGIMSMVEIEEEVRLKLPAMGPIIDSWQSSPMKSADLTSVGIAIAHANWRRATGETEDLDTFLS